MGRIPLLIGLNGFRGSGKDSVADYLVQDYRFKKLAFADRLKDAAAVLWGIPRHWVDDFKEEDLRAYVTLQAGDPDELGMRTKSSMSWRQFLQRFGTEMGREVFGENFWVDLIIPHKDSSTAAADRQFHGNRVISDARFENELLRIHALGGYNVRIVRPGIESDGHASEIEPPDYLIDYTLVNDGSLVDLRVKVLKMVDDIQRKDGYYGP